MITLYGIEWSRAKYVLFTLVDGDLVLTEAIAINFYLVAGGTLSASALHGLIELSDLSHLNRGMPLRLR